MNDSGSNLNTHSNQLNPNIVKRNLNIHQNQNNNNNNRNSPNSQYQGHFLYSSQPHTSPLLHTFNSEWIDTPDNSPSRVKFYNQEMSATTTVADNGASQTEEMKPPQIHQKFETPSKAKAAISFITPVSDAKINETIVINDNHIGKSPSPQEEAPKHEVRNMDIFWSMLNNITGKDKFAKVSQYTLRLLIYHANQANDYLSDDTINFNIISKRYNSKEKRLNLIRNFLNHPQNFIRIIVILVCSIFTSRFKGMVGGLGMYRQFLRFGKTPFRVRDLFNKFSSNVSTNSKTGFIEITNLGEYFNRKTLGDIISLYYGINDEALLLFKLNFLRNKTLNQFVARHESLAWYYDSILGIYESYERVQKFGQQEMDLKIQIQVKNKARVLSKQLLGTNSLNYVEGFPQGDDKKDVQLLKEIQFKKYNSYIDIYKWLSDFIFDTYTVFNIALPFDTIQIWLGITASSLSTLKLYRETKNRLINESSKKL